MHHQKLFVVSSCALLAVGLLPLHAAATENIVINEIHPNPVVKTELVEFIELYNNDTNAVDLSGWSLTSGENFTFPPGANLPAGGYAVVAENPTQFNQKYGFVPYGPYLGKLNNDGDTIVLRNAQGQRVDEVSYKLGFPWPTVGDTNFAGAGTDLSIELIHPDLDNDLGGSWRAAVVKNFVPPSGTTLVPKAATGWKYFKGVSEASTPVTAWRQVGFNDDGAGWLTGQTPFFYESGSGYNGNTDLTDMRNSYSCIFLRKTFNVTNPSEFGSLVLDLESDDAAIVWLNGQVVEILGVSGSEIPFDGTADNATGEPKTSTTPIVASALVQGQNVLAVQALNRSLGGSSDFWVEVSLAALPSGGSTGIGPSPGMRNVVYTNNAPPQIRQVKHSPQQPTSGQTVRITAKATDPDGVASLTLDYQVVEPGNYIELGDAAYSSQWNSLPMRDDGANGDEVAGDDVYTVLLDGSFQVHRRLIRYRVRAQDNTGLAVQVPYPDDPQPNFAYFVYDGVPAWQGSIRPGVEPVMTVPAEEMGRLPAIHLISKKSEVEDCTWFSRYRGNEYRWRGTLVFNGEVYDHITMRARGGVWRYAMVKNMWKFHANRGHEFAGRDDWGGKFARKWTRLNLGASIQQGNFNHRGEQGMFESVGMRMFNIAGVPAARTAFTTLRIIDEAAESGPDQFEGDFWGVYLIAEQMDGRFLDEHGLPDGNLYKMENGTGPGNGSLKNQNPNGPTGNTDLTSWRSQGNSSATEAWWRANFDLTTYYSYYTIVQGIHHYDICCGKNYYWYFHPDDGKMTVFPWDLDLTWADNMFQSGDGGTDYIYDTGRIFDKPGIQLELKNRVREILDLFYNEDEAWRMLDEYARLLQGPATGPTVLDADRAMWDYNPKMISSTYSTDPSSKAGQGRFYQAGTPTKDFNGMVQAMKNYVTTRRSATSYPSGTPLAVWENDPLIPATPSVTYTGPENYPINRLTFRSSNFNGVGQFARMQWRIGEITDPNSPTYDPTQPQKYEIDAAWESTNTTFVADQLIPASVVRVGRTYRVRVRMIDHTGRASHWSPAHQFTCGESENTADLLNFLRITEIMFNPPIGGVEFVELKNISSSVTLDLAGVRFTQGIEYTFEPGVTVPPGGYVVVANTEAIAAFRAFFGIPASVTVVGPFTSGGLDKNGEQLTMRTSAGGTDIVSFDYRDSRGWPVAADGAGHSLVLVDGAEDLQRSTSGDSGTGEYGGSWRASGHLQGSPGQADALVAPSIVLNEIVAHTDYNDPAHPEYDSNDWIELYNTTDTDITLGAGWYLSDEADFLTRWQIPPGTVVPAHGWKAFDEVTGFHFPITAGFGLKKSGEAVFLSYLPGNSENRVVDAVRFKGQANGWSLGRYPDGGPLWYALTPPTRDSANAAPAPHVVISEIMYHPVDIGGTNDNNFEEYVEIYNPTAAPVNLFNTNGAWRLDGVGNNGNFELPDGLVLAPDEYLLIVNIEQTNTVQMDQFRATYHLTDPNLRILGEYSGRLPNNSGRVALERPQAPDLPGEAVSWVIVDEVIYADLPPWPCDTDGTGNSLQRVDLMGHGNDPANWTGQAPSPGIARPPEPAGLPDIITQPSDKIAATNSTVLFNVGVCGTPPFTYQWRFNGINLIGETNATLFLQNLSLGDTGDYTVEVANNAGAVESRPAQLIVQLPPTILTQPQPTTVVRGQTATFTVTAGGTEPLFYQWIHEGSVLSGPEATNRTLVLNQVQVSQAGQYSVNVFNSAGSVLSASATLDLLIPATITQQPQSATNDAGDTVVFTASATGTGSVTYQWYFNGTVISGATGDTLTLPSVQLADAGIYTVVATDDIGSDTSQPAELTVMMAPVITAQPTDQTVSEGGTFTIRVSAQGTLPITYRFRSPVNPYFSVMELDSTNAVLVVENARQAEHDGTWTVAITNVAGRAPLSQRITVTVVPSAPFFVLEPTNQTTVVGASITLDAEARGTAPITYQWYHNGTMALPQATNASLVLNNVQSSTAGDYAVVAANSLGMATGAVARVTVIDAPQILVQPVTQTVNVGDLITLSVAAIGSEPLEYQWTLNGTDIANATGATLDLLNIQLYDAGDYQVRVSNAFGTALSDTATLTVLNPDFDGDGLPLDWELANGLSDENPNDANFDLDRDGMTSKEEYLAGTDPRDGLSYLKINTIVVDPGNFEVRLRFLARSNHTYRVLSRDTVLPGAWISAAEIEASPTDRVVEVTNGLPAEVTSRIYRLVTPSQLP